VRGKPLAIDYEPGPQVVGCNYISRRHTLQMFDCGEPEAIVSSFVHRALGYLHCRVLWGRSDWTQSSRGGEGDS
jgi:hypothetical protein